MKIYITEEEQPFFNWQPRRIYVMADQSLQRYREKIEHLNDDPALTRNGNYHIEVVSIDRSKPYDSVDGMALEPRKFLANDIVAREMPQYENHFAYQKANISDHSHFSAIKQELEDFIDKLSDIDDANLSIFRKWQQKAGKPEDISPMEAFDGIASAEKTDETVRLLFAPQGEMTTKGNIEVRKNEAGGYNVVFVLPPKRECQVTFKNADAEVLYVFLLLHHGERIGLKNISNYKRELMALANTLFKKPKTDEQAAKIADSICRPCMGEQKLRSIIQVQSAANNSVRQVMGKQLPDFSDFKIVTSQEESDTYRSIPLAATATIPEELRTLLF